MKNLGLFIAAFSVFVAATGSLAQAQDPEAGRALHERGMNELADVRFATARDLFIQAIDQHPNVGSGYNLGLAYRGTGESIEAIEIWERLLASEFGEVPDEVATQTRELLRQERGVLSTLELRIEGPERANIRIDGERRGALQTGTRQEFSLNAGRHVVSATSEGFEPIENMVVMNRTEVHRVTLNLSRREESAGVFESASFWIIAGSVLLVGAGLAVAWAMGPYEDDPFNEDPFPVVQVLSAP